MKKYAKEKYQELLEFIEFPVMVYSNETGYVIALNFYGRNLLGSRIGNIKEIFPQDLRLQLRRVVLDVGRKLFYNLKIHTEKEAMELDMEINGILVDGNYLAFCFFEKSYKQIFVKEMSKQVPRLFFKNQDLQYVHASQFFLQDTKQDIAGFIKNENVLALEECSYLRKEDREILKQKRGIFNVILNGIVSGFDTFFVRLHRIPVMNKEEKCLGILGVYTLVMSRSEYREIYSETLRENQILNKVIAKMGIYVLKLEMSKDWPIHYVSPNFVQLGYIRYGLYDGRAFWKNMVHPDDYAQVYERFQTIIEQEETQVPVMKYRIRNFLGDYIWVTDETYSLEQHKSIWFRESVIQINGYKAE